MRSLSFVRKQIGASEARIDALAAELGATCWYMRIPAGERLSNMRAGERLWDEPWVAES
jgi:hypothetical protein